MQYHLYCLDERDKIRSEDWFEASSDDAAIAQVRSMKSPYTCELWDGDKQLARNPPSWSA